MGIYTRESIKIKVLCLFPYGLPDRSPAMTRATGGREADGRQLSAMCSRGRVAPPECVGENVF